MGMTARGSVCVMPVDPDFTYTEAAVAELQRDYCADKIDVDVDEFEERLERVLSDHSYAFSLVAPSGLPPAIGKRENR